MFPADGYGKRAHSSWTTCPLIQSPLSRPGPMQYPPWPAPRPPSSIGVRTDLWAGCWCQMHSRDIHSAGGDVWEVRSLEGLHQWGSCCPEIWVWCWFLEMGLVFPGRESGGEETEEEWVPPQRRYSTLWSWQKFRKVEEEGTVTALKKIAWGTRGDKKFASRSKPQGHRVQIKRGRLWKTPTQTKHLSGNLGIATC